MTKEEARKKLQSYGYRVLEDHSVITILIPAEKSMNSVLKDVRSKLAQMGYESSFGIRQVQEGEEIAENNNETIITEDLDEDKAVDVRERAYEPKEPLNNPDLEAQTINTLKEEEFFDDEDDDFGGVSIDEEDMDMLLNEESIQFSLDDFGLN